MKHLDISIGLGIGDRANLISMDTRIRRGEWDNVIAALENNTEDVPDILIACLNARRDPSLIAQLRPQLDQFIKEHSGEFPDRGILQCLAMAGDPDRAVKLALQAVDINWQSVSMFWKATRQPAKCGKLLISNNCWEIWAC